MSRTVAIVQTLTIMILMSLGNVLNKWAMSDLSALTLVQLGVDTYVDKWLHLPE